MAPDARAIVALMLATAACNGGGGAAQAPPAPQTAISMDAGAPVVDAGITTLPSYDPRGGYFLDPDPGAPRAPGRNPRRDRAPLSLLLRSTPAGAIAAVDGIRLGPTPALWDGEAGAAHEFTFVLAGHALARYRFVPLVSGVVHGTLVRIASDAPAPEIPAALAPGPAIAQPRQPAPSPPIDAAPPPIIDASPELIDAPPAPPLPPTGPTP